MPYFLCQRKCQNKSKLFLVSFSGAATGFKSSIIIIFKHWDRLGRTTKFMQQNESIYIFLRLYFGLGLS